MVTFLLKWEACKQQWWELSWVSKQHSPEAEKPRWEGGMRMETELAVQQGAGLRP